MKKILSILLVAMFTMAAMVFAQNSSVEGPYFTIKNQSTDEVKSVSVTNFSSSLPWGVSVTFDKGVFSGDILVFTYNSPATPQLAWFYGWLDYTSLINIPLGSGVTKEVTVKNVPTSEPLNNTLLVQCDYQHNGFGGGTPKSYIINIPNISQKSRVTAKNINASEVQVTYENYAEVSSGQRASVALYDIYGNSVSTGYLDNLGMSTLSTKGKPGIYIVKVIMNNQVIFNQRIQVK